MSTPPSINADALAVELAKLPALSTSAPVELDPLRIALARAVASGQDADQLARDLSTPGGWQSIDFSKPPILTKAGAPPPQQPIPVAAEVAIARPVAAAAPPEWISTIVPIALKKNISSRVVVLDHEPTALGGLELPAWARALSPAAAYGPINVTSAQLQITTTKWIVIFHFIETVQFVRGSMVLCVLPISSSVSGSATDATISSGSAWLAAQPFVSSAPSDGYAGIAMQSGEIHCDQPLTFGSTTVTVPATATLSLSLVPSASPVGPAGFPTNVTAPTKIDATFPPSGLASITAGHCSAVLYSEPVECAQSHLPAAYNAELGFLYIPGKSSAATFTPIPVTGKLFEFAGSAPIESAGWALSVSESMPTTLGMASGPGYFAVVFGVGISCHWTDIARREPALIGSLIVQNNSLYFSVLSGSPPGLVIEQKFDLWDDQDTNNKRRCQLIAGRVAGQLLLYALAPHTEIVSYVAVLDALVDRPVLATGARIPAVFLSGNVGLVRNNSGHHLIVTSSTPDPEVLPNSPPAAFPMALDNALLDVGVPASIFINATTDAQFNAGEGLVLILFGYLLIELYLPDPYTGGYNTGQDIFDIYGYLLAEIGWSKPSQVIMRLIDTAHKHPAKPPTTEAGSTPVPPPVLNFPFPIHPIPFESSPEQALVSDKTVAPTAAEPLAVAPKPPAYPRPENAYLLLDVSTRASLLGVEVTNNNERRYTIDGISVRGPASLLPLFTLPAIAWEPMYNTAPVQPISPPPAPPPSSPTDKLLFPPGDGPITEVRPTSATLIPISPLQSLQALLYAGQGGFTAALTLPFGITGALDAATSKGTLLPNLTLVQPSFPASSTPAGSIYTGAWQLSFTAPDPTQPNPVFAGRSYLRNYLDNPPAGDLSYGEQVLGRDVADIFTSRFNDIPSQGTTGVPLRRYDLTGYGASTFSEWTNTTTPHPTDVIKAHFHVLIGRTSHELIQVQSIIYPWAIKVVRTITIDREGSGSVLRYDSGWQAASDGLFDFPAEADIPSTQIQAGLLTGLINVSNIRELGFPVSTLGTEDGTSHQEQIQLQPVTFNADVAIQPQHQVIQGGATLQDLSGNSHVCVASTGITGFIGLRAFYHLDMSNMANFTALANGAGGPINAILNVASAKSLLRATSFDATPISDTATSGLGLAVAVRGLPKLSSDGHWSMGSRTQSQAAPVPINPTTSVPLVQPNTGGGSTPDKYVHFADPADIFRLAAGSSTPPATFYGFLQATGTQSNFLSRPILTYGTDNLTLGDALNVAHAGALLGAISSFPAITSCLQFPGSDLIPPIQNQSGNATFAITQGLTLSPTVHSTPVRLISCSVAHADLYFYWQGEDPSVSLEPTVQIALGQTTGPSWSLDINHIAVGLTIPSLDSGPLLALQGSFHADADTLPAFPKLDLVFYGILAPVTKFLTALSDIAGVIGSQDPTAPPPGLNMNFSNGKLAVTDNFALPSIPLGPGTINDISLDIGATMDIVGLSIDFLLSIGTPDAPVHWIVDPLSGTFCLEIGVQNNAPDILIQAGIGIGLAIDLGIASGSASITIAVQIQISGTPTLITLLFLLTGQAEVDVLGGLASAALTITAGLGLSFNPSDPLDANLIGTASVGIHISICWVINISWSGSWTFQKEINLQQLT
ncbi:MAG TPA: hypothetical protein VK729_03430 [Silvibacterium sp.]|nr:hypothetical protein [Silvibacterium sp.]